MFLTVTANAALDHLIYIKRFEPATTMRTDRVIDAVGGKGYDVSVAFRCLGQPTTAVGFIAGKTGQVLAQIIEAYGIHTDLVWIEGETRTANVIIETERHRHSHIITGGYTVSERGYRMLLERFAAHLDRADWVVASGSIPTGVPEDVYGTICCKAHEFGVPVLVDTTGSPLRQALSACPEVVKLNVQEFASTFGFTLTMDETSLDKGRELIRTHHLNSLVITQGAKGLLAFTPQGDFQVAGPKLQAVNAAGAGDATSACLVWRLSQGKSWEEALRWAVAAGAATVLTERTAECDWKVVQELYPRVTLSRLD